MTRTLEYDECGECPDPDPEPPEKEPEMPSSTKDGCGCHCICDPTVARQFDQTSGRYNDQSGFASAQSLHSFNNMNSMFLAQAQNSLEQTPQTGLLTQLTGLVTLIRGGGAPGV